MTQSYVTILTMTWQLQLVLSRRGTAHTDGPCDAPTNVQHYDDIVRLCCPMVKQLEHANYNINDGVLDIHIDMPTHSFVFKFFEHNTSFVKGCGCKMSYRLLQLRRIPLQVMQLKPQLVVLWDHRAITKQGLPSSKRSLTWSFLPSSTCVIV